MIVLFFLALALFCSPVDASRPFGVTDDAVTLAKGRSRAETGFTFERFAAHRWRYTIQADLAYGLMDNLEFELETPLFFETKFDGTGESGFGDIRLKTKVRFMEERRFAGGMSSPSVSGQIAIKFPTCREKKVPKVFGQQRCVEEADVALVALARTEFFPYIFHLNVGYTLVGNPAFEDLNNVFSGSAALEYISEWEPLRLIGEIAGETNKDPAQSGLVSLLGGVSYFFTPDVVGDTSISLGVTRDAPDYVVRLGMTFRF